MLTKAIISQLLRCWKFGRKVSFTVMYWEHKYLFYGRKAISTDTEPIEIGPIGSVKKTLHLTISWDITEFKDGKLQTRPLEQDESHTNALLSPRFNQHINDFTLSFPLEASLPSNMLKPDVNEINSFYITSDGLDRGYLADLWDKVAIGERRAEEDVLNALRIAAPGIERLYLTYLVSMARGTRKTNGASNYKKIS